jgi:hypothetical protein
MWFLWWADWDWFYDFTEDHRRWIDPYADDELC